MNTTSVRACIVAVAAAASVLTPSFAFAGGGETLSEGACSGSAVWKMKVNEALNNQAGVEYEVDANRRGQQWRVTLFHNGTRILRDTFTTGGLSGSFEARALEPNMAGDDRFRARAVRLSDGQTCAGSVLFDR
jgi:hypothetical protein